MGLGAALEVLTPDEHDNLMASGSPFAMELRRDARSVWSRRPGGAKATEAKLGKPHESASMNRFVPFGSPWTPEHSMPLQY